MPVTTNKNFRKANRHFFEQSGIRLCRPERHHPFLVLNRTGESTTSIEVVNNTMDLIKYPAKTRVLIQWRGNRRSDFYKFTVGEFKRHLRANPAKTGQRI